LKLPLYSTQKNSL